MKQVSQDETVKSLEKALRLLICFDPDNLELRNIDLVRKTGLSKATVHRILSTFAKFAILERRDTTEKYTVGPALYTLGSLYLYTTDVLKALEPVTKTLNNLTEEAVNVAIYDKSNIVFVMREEPKYAFRFAIHIGTVLPAYATALGRAFLSELTESQVDSLYPQEALHPITPKTITSREALKSALNEVKRTGTSIDIEGGVEGVEGIASLIRDVTGKAVAAMGIGVPIFRMDKAKRKRFASLVKMACSLASYRLGYRQGEQLVRNLEELSSWWEHNE